MKINYSSTNFYLYMSNNKNGQEVVFLEKVTVWTWIKKMILSKISPSYFGKYDLIDIVAHQAFKNFVKEIDPSDDFSCHLFMKYKKILEHRKLPTVAKEKFFEGFKKTLEHQNLPKMKEETFVEDFKETRLVNQGLNNVAENILREFISPFFINETDILNLALVNKSTYKLFKKQLTALKEIYKKIDTLNKSSSDEEFQEIFNQLMTSFFKEGMVLWKKITEKFLKVVEISKKNNRNDDYISLLRKLTKEVPSKKSKEITPLLCLALCSTLKNSQPWIKYRIFEGLFSWNEKSAKMILTQHLLTQELIKPKETLISGFNVRELDIRPDRWFGFNQSRYSLWMDPKTGEDNAFLPNFIKNVLVEMCVNTAKSSEIPLVVNLFGRTEAEIGDHHAFHFYLVNKLLNKNIFVNSSTTLFNNRVNRSVFEHPYHTMSNGGNLRITQEAYQKALTSASVNKSSYP